MPFPVAEQPVAIASTGPEPIGVTSLGESAAAYASGHAPAPSPAVASPPAGPSWQQQGMDLASERPELVVGAAFAGGILAAMILRRLGN